MLKSIITQSLLSAAVQNGEGQKSLWSEILRHIREHWFAVELGAYEYIRITPNTEGNLRMLIISAMLGIILAAAIMLYNKRGVGGFVKKLIKAEALSKEKALTLYEIGYFRRGFLRHELRRGNALRRYVKCVEEEEFEAAAAATAAAADASETEGEGKVSEFRMDFSNMRFYIPEDLKYAAEVRYEQKGSGLLAFLLVVVCTVVGGVLVSTFLPDLLRFADWLIRMTAPA